MVSYRPVSWLMCFAGFFGALAYQPQMIATPLDTHQLAEIYSLSTIGDKMLITYAISAQVGAQVDDLQLKLRESLNWKFTPARIRACLVRYLSSNAGRYLYAYRTERADLKASTEAMAQGLHVQNYAPGKKVGPSGFLVGPQQKRWPSDFTNKGSSVVRLRQPSVALTPVSVGWLRRRQKTQGFQTRRC